MNGHDLSVMERCADQWIWVCCCGADGSARRQDLAGAAWRAHRDEARVAA